MTAGFVKAFVSGRLPFCRDSLESIHMTTQVQDTIIYHGNWHFLASEPFAAYDPFPKFVGLGSDNHRGYTAIWAVVAGYLFLVSLSGLVEKATDIGFETVSRGFQELSQGDRYSGVEGAFSQVSLETLFPGCQEPVRADWYSGELRIPGGRVVDSSMGFSLFEREDILTIECGRVMGSRKITREWNPEQLLDPILLRPIEDLELKVKTTSQLKAANIHHIGSLAALTVTKLTRVASLDLDAIEEIIEEMASRGLTPGMHFEGWPPRNIDGNGRLRTE